MKGNRCCIVVVIIIGLIFSIPIRDDDTVKHSRFQDISITSTKKPANTHLLFEHTDGKLVTVSPLGILSSI